jgi:outer membrane protein OmpA-like peptidoglycan-associated protein
MKLFIVNLWVILGVFYYFFWDYQQTHCCTDSVAQKQSAMVSEKESNNSDLILADSLKDTDEKQVPKDSVVVSEREETMELDTLVFYFTYNSSALQIPEAYEAQLRKLIKYLKENPETSLEITGHTDNLGSREANRKVGLNRAETMKTYLQGLGVQNSIKCKSMGEDQPIADNATSEGRSTNRRIELTTKNILR